MNRDDPFINNFYRKYLYHSSKYNSPNYRRYYKCKQSENLYRYNYENQNQTNQNSTNFRYSPPKKYRNIFTNRSPCIFQ